MSRVRPAVFSLLSYFRVPEHMADYEKLSVASLSGVRRARDGAIRFVGPAHVAEPMRFRHYYPEQEWLAHVQRDHVRCFVGRHDASNGALIERAPLVWRAHDALDLVVARLERESDLSRLEAAGDEWLLLDDGATSGDADGVLEAHGFVLCDDDVCMRRTVVAGDAWSRDAAAQRLFVHTATTLAQGMCGGAVVARHAPGSLLGIVEGVVKTGPRHLLGTAALIDRSAIQKFGDVL